MLEKRYGALVGGWDLREALGYRSAAAFHRAVRDGHVNVTLFGLPGRRGRFALVADIASWLESAAQHAERAAASRVSGADG
jgi:hypothetical protein